MPQERRLLIRDILHCKPGRVRPMVERFLRIAELYKEKGLGPIRVLTDVSAERYRTLVSEIEVDTLEAYMAAEHEPEVAQKVEQIMKDDHDLVAEGRREIYTVEG